MARVLIVDDSKTACSILARKLKQLDVQSDSVYSAQAAFDYLEQSHPDVIFMDHNMPGIDGLQAIKIIRSNPRTATIPVMMYTSERGEYYVGQARALGAIDVLPKELGTAHIQHALNQLGLLEGPVAVSSIEQEDIDKHALSVNEVAADSEPEIAAEAEPVSPIVVPKEPATAPTTPAPPAEDVATVVTREVKAALGHLNEGIHHQLYLTTVEVQQVLEEQMEQTVVALKKQMNTTATGHIKQIRSDLDQVADEMKLQTATFHQERESNQRWIKASCLGLAVLALSLVYTANRLGDMEMAQASNKVAMAEMEARLAKRMVVGSKHPPVEATAATEAASESPAALATAGLFDDGGQLIGEVIGWDRLENTATVVNNQGYSFQVAADGAVVSDMPQRFYVNGECYGDTYVKALPGQLFSDIDGSLWFTPKQIEQEFVEVSSQLNVDGSCQWLDGVEALMHVVYPNDPGETGIIARNLGPLSGVAYIDR